MSKVHLQLLPPAGAPFVVCGVKLYTARYTIHCKKGVTCRNCKKTYAYHDVSAAHSPIGTKI